MEECKLLPIGSIVKVMDRNIMIYGYFPIMDKKMYTYYGCEYPYGILNIKETIAFNMDTIQEVLYVGYKTDEYVKYVNLLKDSIKEISSIVNE